MGYIIPPVDGWLHRCRRDITLRGVARTGVAQRGCIGGYGGVPTKARVLKGKVGVLHIGQAVYGVG
eukprot:764507-Hanusia_phi.AAC.1